jgi:dihydrolipoamide dehydrogenase
MAEAGFDVAVAGGGPGGYVAAIRAAQLGMKTAVVEEAHLGGICLNWGCIPTKALLRTAEVYHLAENAKDFGLKISGLSFDLDAVIQRSRKIADRLSNGVGFLMKKHKIEVFDGRARLAGKGALSVSKGGKETAKLKAKHIILATGARARSLPGLEPDGKLVWTYREAMVPDTMPKSLLVIGSGAIGMEFASFYRTLGAEVTVVEVVDRILPAEDAEISKLAQRAFENQGIKFHTGATVKSLKKAKNSVSATVEGGTSPGEIKADRAILSVGITGNVEDIGLEGTKVKVEKGHIVIDEWCRTGEAGIYAIGDVAGPPWLAHKAMHEGVVCVEKIAGVEDVHPMDTSRIPGCTYCHPQIASVGLSEDNAKKAGYEVRVGKFPLTANGKAIALGDDNGLVKTVFDAKTGELLGAHMIGPEVTELIQGFAVAKSLETTEAELMATIFPHPTLSEAMHEAVLGAYGRALHI